MSSHAALGLFDGLVDDAGLFPPEELAMAVALARHREDAAQGSRILSNRFVCPASRASELTAQLSPADSIDVVLVAPLGSATLASALLHLGGDGRVRLAGVEGPPGDGSTLAIDALPPSVPCSVEVSLTGEWRAALGALAGTRSRAKVRCGGARPEMFPSAEQLGTFVHACAEAGVPFKATAGLHHATPYRDEATGFSHHGFLNLVLAACRAAQGAAPRDVVDVLEVSDSGALADEARAIAPEKAAAARQLFVSYGSCSTAEPVADLRALALIDLIDPVESVS